MDRLKKMIQKNKLWVVMSAIVIIYGGMIIRDWFFLPSFFSGETVVKWKERSYHLDDYDGKLRRCVVGKKIAGSEFETRLFSLEGDRQKAYHAVYRETYYELFIEDGCCVPEEGEITGVITEILSDSGTVNLSAHNRFVEKEKMEKIPELFISEQEFLKLDADTDITGDNFYNIYACFDHWPVAGKFLGTIGQTGDEIIFIPNEKDDYAYGENYAFSVYYNEKDQKKFIIRKDTEYFIIPYKEVEKEIKTVYELYD